MRASRRNGDPSAAAVTRSSCAFASSPARRNRRARAMSAGPDCGSSSRARSRSASAAPTSPRRSASNALCTRGVGSAGPVRIASSMSSPTPSCCPMVWFIVMRKASASLVNGPFSLTAVSTSKRAAATSSFAGGSYSGIEPSALSSRAMPFCTSCRNRMRARKNAAFCLSGSLAVPSSTRVHEASAVASCSIGSIAVLTRSSAQTAKSEAVSALAVPTAWNVHKSAAPQIALRRIPQPPRTWGR